MKIRRWKLLFLLAFGLCVALVLIFFCFDMIPNPAVTTTYGGAYHLTQAEKHPPAESEPTEFEKVNVNTADLETLMTVPGIGATRAQTIIDDRSLHGRFHTLEELTRVNGITDAVLDALRDYITVS